MVERFDAGKARWDLLPPGPLSELVNVFTYGSLKYKEESWRDGYKFKPTFAAMLRHAFRWFAGETHDPESGCHHLAHVAWNALVLIEYQALNRTDLDDRAKTIMPITPTTAIKQPPISVHNKIVPPQNREAREVIEYESCKICGYVKVLNENCTKCALKEF
jgi:hypothetical protein